MEPGMKNFACRYAIVQFAPYTETGEFANVGIVIACPETGHFAFKLQTRRYARITAFFDELNGDVYRMAIKSIQTELERIQRLVVDLPATPMRADQIREVLTALTHPREAMVRFSQVRPVLAQNPAAHLVKLFDHYVDHAFATPEFVEQTITKRIQNLLDGLTLPAPFKSERIGDDQIHANFPLVQRKDGELTKIIKPFNLAQDEANRIFDHGDAWLQKVRRLRRRNLLPRDVLFAVAAPPEADLKRFGAYQEICGELRQEDVQLVEQLQMTEIERFAKA
jgi:Protein of unknown function (DUF3037)